MRNVLPIVAFGLLLGCGPSRSELLEQLELEQRELSRLQDVLKQALGNVMWRCTRNETAAMADSTVTSDARRRIHNDAMAAFERESKKDPEVNAAREAVTLQAARIDDIKSKLRDSH